MRRCLTLAFVLLGLSASAAAQEREDLRRVVLANGDVYVGTVADEEADPLVIVTTDGIERQFRRDQVTLVAPLIRGRFFRTDPVKTRLFFAPTARTLGAGEFRGDLAYVFPSVTAGLSDRIDFIGSGFVTFGDGAGLATPLVGVKGLVYDGASTKVALGTSALFTFGEGTEGGFAAVPYGVVTIGDETRAISFGVGGAIGSYGTEGVDVANGVLIGFGAETQLNNGVKLFVESLAGVSLGEADGDSGLIILPGVRFFGNRFAFDLIGIVATDFDSVFGFAPIGARASYAF